MSEVQERRRIVACLDLLGGRVVKGVGFEGIRDRGDPVELAARYAAQGADELALLDIEGKPEERAGILGLVRTLSGQIDIPLLFGGGVSSLADAEALVEAGATRISVNSALVRDPSLLPSLARHLGPQRIVASIDAKWESAEARHRVYIQGGRRATGLDAVEWATMCVERGAGEILLTSIDRDGGREGFDLALIEAVARAVPVPVIASGGCGSPVHCGEAFRAGARAVLAAGILHDGSYGIQELRNAG